MILAAITLSLIAAAPPECADFIKASTSEKNCEQRKVEFEKLLPKCRGAELPDEDGLAGPGLFDEAVVAISTCLDKNKNKSEAVRVLKLLLKFPDREVDWTTHTISLHNLLKSHIEAIEVTSPAKCRPFPEFESEVKKFVKTKDLSHLKENVRRPFSEGMNHLWPAPFADTEAYIKKWAKKSALKYEGYSNNCFWISGWKGSEVSERGICHTYIEGIKPVDSCIDWSRFPPGYGAKF